MKTLDQIKRWTPAREYYGNTPCMPANAMKEFIKRIPSTRPKLRPTEEEVAAHESKMEALRSQALNIQPMQIIRPNYSPLGDMNIFSR